MTIVKTEFMMNTKELRTCEMLSDGRPTEVCEPSSTVSRVYISRLWRSIDEALNLKTKKKKHEKQA